MSKSAERKFGLIEFVLKAGVCLAVAALSLYSAASLAAAEDVYKESETLYQKGDFVTAMAKLRPVAESGHAPSQALLADILERAGFLDEAVSWYQKAAALEYPDAMLMLGSLHATGRGVPKDDTKAAELVTKAAKAGHAYSINYLASGYMVGLMGLPKLTAEDKTGLPWVKQSAGSGHLPAIDFLAQAYRTGALGETDIKQAEALEAQANKIRYAGRKPPKKKG